MHRLLISFFRNIKNNPRIFFINIAGFSIGVVSALFIYLFVVKEYKTDRFHKNHNDIYRVVQNWKGTDVQRTTNYYPLGDLLQKQFSEVQDFTRYLEGAMYKINIGENTFRTQKISFVDRSFFKIFNFNLLVGDYNTLFDSPNNVILNQETAIKYFNSVDVIGKTIEVQDPKDNGKRQLTVSGILDVYPEESTLQPVIIADISSEEEKNIKREWRIRSPQLFLYIPNCKTPENVASKISETVANGIRSTYKGYKTEIDPNRYELQKLTNIYLGSSNVQDEFPKGDKRLANILLAIGFILLSITFVNSVISNLGLSVKKQKNDQIHNVLGCSSGWLRRKIISESVLFSVLAFFVSLILYPVIHSGIISFSNYQYGMYTKSDTLIFFSFFMILIFFGTLSGLIQNTFVKRNSNQKFEGLRFGPRKMVFNRLIQFQLIVFIVASISLFFIVRQVNLIQSIEMGFDIENTFSLRLVDEKDQELFKQEFEKYPYVKSIAFGEQLFKTEYRSDDIKIADSDNTISSQVIQGDHNYLKAYNIRLLKGENLNKDKFRVGEDLFSFKRKSNSLTEVLVNEEFVKRSGLENPIGTIIEGGRIFTGKIVGIIGNVKNLPVYQSVKPMVIGYDMAGSSGGIAASVEEGFVEQFKTDAKLFYNMRSLEDSFHFSVWQYDFEREYQKEQIFSRLIIVFTIIILSILLLGLVGLSLFIAEGKTKEIGIRKVNGAKVTEILSMLNKDFIKWVAIAFIIATPIAYYAMNKWLENFAYKTTLSWWIFALAGVIALGIALLTVSWQSWRAATRNPVEALRCE